MSFRAIAPLVSAAVLITTLGLPGAAAATPPVGECPSSFTPHTVFDTPEHFLEAALGIDKNDDLVVCFKPMANETRTNVVDNVSHPN